MAEKKHGGRERQTANTQSKRHILKKHMIKNKVGFPERAIKLNGGIQKKEKRGKDNKCPPSVALWFFKVCFYMSASSRLHSEHPWRAARLHLSSPGPITTQLSAPAPIIILLATNTAQLPPETPHTRARRGLAKKARGEGEISGQQQQQRSDSN